MLKTLRISISLILFILISFYFLDFAGLMPESFRFLAKIQFIPALLSVNIVVLVVLLLATFLFGRIYCSSVCPLGVMQDIFNWFSKKFTKKKRFRYSKAKTILRWSIVGVIVVSFFIIGTLLLGLLDPYSIFGRIVTNVFKPLYMEGNNVLESIFTSYGNYTFYKVDASILSISSFVIALLTFFIIAFLAWKNGRIYCNTICPVGTILGIVSKFSIFKIRIDESKCNACGSCSRTCKASCIDGKNKYVDNTRCIECFNCLDSCKQHALIYSPKIKTKENAIVVENQVKNDSRRQFLTTVLATGVAAPVAIAQDKISMLAPGQGKAYKRAHPIAPPGSGSIEEFTKKCTSCHLCVSRCPSRVLKPALMEYGIGGIMQATMFFEKGFCNFDCTVCSEICPTGAIQPLTREQKHLTQVGQVVFIEENCIVLTEGTNCGACSEHCPTQAVAMIPYKDGLTIPSVNTDICVGCGGCEYVCPVRPYRAIYVEGNPVQVQAKPIEDDGKVDIEIDDFGF